MGENGVSCETVQQRAVAWLEEQLAPAELEQIGMHIETCEDCAGYVAKLDAIDLRPPRVHHAHPSRKQNFWDNMDVHLRSEMSVLYEPEPDQNYRQSRSSRLLYVFAAGLVLSLIWGAKQHQKVNELHTQIQMQQREIERMERMFATPPQPQVLPKTQFSVHVPARMEL